MGEPKSLLPWGESTLVGHCTQVALDASCHPVLVVAGDEFEAIGRALNGLDVRVVAHAGWRGGLGSSIAAGIAAIADEVAGVVILLGDQPFVTPELLAALRRGCLEPGRGYAACRYRDTLGPPACFASSTFGQLRALTGDRGARSLLAQAGRDVAVVDFPAGAFDIDTREDYARALAECARQRDGR